MAIILLFSDVFFVTGTTKLGDIIFQGFGWKEYNQSKVILSGSYYKYIQSKIDDLKDAGFTIIWMPNVLNSPDSTYKNSSVQKKEILDYVWGDSSELSTLIRALQLVGIRTVADVNILNNLNSPTIIDMSCDLGAQKEMYVNQTDEQIVQNLKDLIMLGFEGWRLNTIKGKLSRELKEYINSTHHYFSFGENWDTSENGVFKYSVEDSVSTATSDYLLYYSMMLEGFEEGNWERLGHDQSMGGLVGVEKQAEKVVTFVDNVNTFNKRSSEETTEFMNKIMMGYAYILTHPGIPSVFLPHYYGGNYSKDGITVDYGNGIKPFIDSLLVLRKINNISTDSKIKVSSNSSYYSDYIYTNDGTPSIALSLGHNSGLWQPTGDGWKIAMSGLNYKIWAKNINKEKMEMNNKVDNLLSIYPNPTFGRIKLLKPDIISIVITNVVGKTMFSDPDFEGEDVDISSYASGTYVVIATDTKGMKYSSLVLKR